MFECAGCRQLLDRRAPFGPCDRPARAFFERGDVVADIFGLAIEDDMFARMHRFLIDEIVDLAAQRLRRAFAILPDRCHEEFLADREGGRQRVEKGGATGVAAVPPARRGLLAAELHVALLDPEIGRRGRVEGHEQLLRIINININVYNANIRHSQEMLLSCFRTAFSEADRKAVSLAYIGLRPC